MNKNLIEQVYQNTIGKSIFDRLSYILICLLGILPFLYISGWQYGYEDLKYPFFVSSIWLLAVITVLYQLLSKKKITLELSLLDKVLFTYVFITFLADIFGLDPRTSIQGSSWRHQGFILLVACLILFILGSICIKYLHSTFIKKSFIILALVNIGLTLIGLIEILQVYIFQNVTIVLYEGRIIGSLGSPSALAGILCMTLPFVWIVEKKRVGENVVMVSITLLNIVVILFTESRGALIAVGVILLLFIFRETKDKRKLLVGSLLVFVLSLGVYFSGVFPKFLSRYSIWDNRGYIWSEGIQAVLKRPMLGYGQENFELIYPKDRQVVIDNAHNIFLEIGLSSGLLGLGIYMYILYIAFKQSNYMLSLALFAFVIRAQFNPLSVAEIVYFWWFLILSKAPKRA